MSKLMKERSVVVDLLEEGGLRRDVDGIVHWAIERLRATEADIGAGGLGERLGLRHDLALGQGGRMSKTMLGKFIALINIEDGIAVQEGTATNATRFRMFGAASRKSVAKTGPSSSNFVRAATGWATSGSGLARSAGE